MPQSTPIITTTEPETNTNSKKRTHSKPHFKGQEHTTRTIKSPPWTYIHLSLLCSSSSAPTISPAFDSITARNYLTAALTQFLGLSGSAISVDILKIEGNELWIRVPREDGGVLLAAVGGWVGGSEESVGWKVVGWGNWLGALIGDGGLGNAWGD